MGGVGGKEGFFYQPGIFLRVEGLTTEGHGKNTEGKITYPH